MKLVREHINEKFTEQGDPVHDMGIGPRGIFDELRDEMEKSGSTAGVLHHALRKDPDTAAIILKYWFEHEQKINMYDFNTLFANMQLDKNLVKPYKEKILPVLIDAAIAHQDQNALDIALFECAKKNFTEEVIKLAKGGANPTMRSNKPIALAIRHRNKEMFDALASYIKWKKPKK